ncbi:MAG: branched-chain amino acid ABC transporter permease [Acidimicrobiia bacterium]
MGDRWRALSRQQRLIAFLAFLVVLYTLPLWKPPLIYTPQTDFVGTLFAPVILYVMVAVGLNVVVGQAGMLDLGYVAFYAIGAYTVGILSVQHASWPFWACVPVAVAAAMVAGVLLGTPTLRLRGDYLAIVTLGFGEIIRITAKYKEWLGASRGIDRIPRPPALGPLKFELLDAKPYYWLGLTVLIFVIFLTKRLETSRVGRAWTAIREDEDAAELMGVPTFRFKLWAFAIGAAVGGLSGALFAGRQSSIGPETFNLTLSILFLAAVVLGGAGNLPGVILGAVMIAYLPERFRFFAEKRVLVFGLALVVLMIFRPEGLLPSRRRAQEIADTESGTAAGVPHV